MNWSQPPNDVKDCSLYLSLAKKSRADIDGLEEKVGQIIEHASNLLDSIAGGPFKDYTLHNRNHAKKVVHLAGCIIGVKKIDRLSVLDIAIIIMSSYIHDLGMCLSAEEKSQILIDAEFQKNIRRWPRLYQEIEEVRKNMYICDKVERPLMENKLSQLIEAALSYYLRPLHATEERCKQYTSKLKKLTGRQDLFEIRDVSFEKWLIEICVSHNLEAGVLNDSTPDHNERFPRDIFLGNERLNTQFCAAVLRLSDILDFDSERTPRSLFENLAIDSKSIPGAEVSLKEWQKHMSVHSIFVKPDEIEVFSNSPHPAIEKTIREFCQQIERELRDTTMILKKNPPNILKNYNLDLPISVRPRITSVGYVYKDMSFELNQPTILKLLMGERLYSSPEVAVRELLQNAVDACAAREFLSDSDYKPEIKVEQYRDDANYDWLEVSDNGIGMDDHVLNDYFFHVGSCYYNSPEFESLPQISNKPFQVTSRFGIGVISAFMIGDWLEITTQNNFSVHGDKKCRCARIDGNGGLAYVTEGNASRQGTIVRVRLKSNPNNQMDHIWHNIAEYIYKTVLRPKYEVCVNIPNHRFNIKPQNFYFINSNSIKHLEKQSIEYFEVKLEEWSKILSGRIILFFCRKENGTLSYKTSSNKILRINETTIKPSQIINGYNGNRITVDGFQMKLADLTRIFHGRVRIPMILDVDVKGEPFINYDVSREKIIGDTQLLIRRELYKVVLNSLKASEIYSRLNTQAQFIMSKEYTGSQPYNQNTPTQLIKSTEDIGSQPYNQNSWSFKLVEDEVVLARVQELLPNGPWPKHIHKEIAELLGISNNLSRNSIGTLLEIGRIKKINWPNSGIKTNEVDEIESLMPPSSTP